MVAARAADGHVECFKVTENEHRNHSLEISTVPAKVSPQLAAEAKRVASRIAKALDYVGVLTMEISWSTTRANGPCWSTRSRRGANRDTGRSTARPCRNSSSPFAPSRAGPGQAAAARPKVEMTDLIGAEIHEVAHWLTIPGASVHLYGRTNARAGRKMGHVTRFIRRWDSAVIPRPRPGGPPRNVGLQGPTAPLGAAQRHQAARQRPSNSPVTKAVSDRLRSLFSRALGRKDGRAA